MDVLFRFFLTMTIVLEHSWLLFRLFSFILKNMFICAFFSWSVAVLYGQASAGKFFLFFFFFALLLPSQ